MKRRRAPSTPEVVVPPPDPQANRATAYVLDYIGRHPIVAEAFALAATVHAEDGYRGRPYLFGHLLPVMLRCSENEVTRAAALLHDSVEDHGLSVVTIADRCGQSVASIVLQVTRFEGVTYDDYMVPLLETGSAAALEVKEGGMTVNRLACIDDMEAGDFSRQSIKESRYDVWLPRIIERRKGVDEGTLRGL